MDKNTELTIEECKGIQLQIVQYIDSICKENGITYSLGFGTLIGAIRHKGFIPWDDDIDLIMPRKDFDRFKRYIETHPSQDYHKLDYENSFFNIIKICDSHTRISEKRSIRIPDYGVWVDIFPFDELQPPDSKESIKDKRKYRFIRKLSVTRALNFEHANTLSGLKKYSFMAVRLLLQLFPYTFFAKELNKMAQKNNGKNTGYIGCYTKYTKPNRPKDEIDADCFSEFIDVEFENLELKAIKNYDKFLKTIYGDYMQLPPESKRVGHEYRAFRR